MQLFLNNNSLEQVSSSKHLGLLFTEDLRWSEHIDAIVKKANSKIGLLYRTKERIQRKDKINIYRTIIRPALEYGNVIYDNCTICESDKIECVQKCTARVCTGAMKRTEYKNLQTELGWNSLKSRRSVAKGCLTYKILNSQTPEFLRQNFKTSRTPERSLRMKNRLLPIKCRLSSYSKSFFPDQSLFWNKLSSNLVNKGVGGPNFLL